MAAVSNQDVQPANPLSRKVAKILDSKFETDKDTLEALQTLSDCFPENTAQARRNLRRDVERRSLAINREFLQNFKAVRESLDQLNTTVRSMTSCCDDMTHRLQTTKEQTRDLINQTTKLQQESKALEKRREIAKAFLDTFQLRPDETKALKGKVDGSITKDFFPALVRVKEIHSDCKLLLRTNQSRAGLEIMENMSLAQEKAYELLYRWIQREARLLNVDAIELNQLLCEAMRAMQDRPVLFKYSLDEFSAARRNNIVRGFIDALTRGGPGGVPKPIELLSHDPLRYVGDMLAWIHQAIASEKELLHVLLKLCDHAGNSAIISQSLCHVSEGLCRPFKVRVEQVLTGENGPVLLYRLSNLCRFYQDTIKGVLAQDAPLIETIVELHQLTQNLFLSSLNSHMGRLLERIDNPSHDMQPVQGLHQILLLLRDVLESHDATLVPVDDKQQNFNKIFGCVVDPLMQQLLLSATNLSAVEVAVYMLNCLHAVQSVLSLYEYTDRRLEMLQAQIEAQCDVLVSEQAGYILKRTAMTSLYNTVVQHKPSQGPLSSLHNSDAATITAALHKFDLFLASPDSYKLPQLKLVSSPKIKDMINRRTMDVICTAYEEIYNKIHDPVNQFSDPSAIASKSVEQVKGLVDA